MKPLASLISIILTGTALIFMAILLDTNQLEYCGQSEALRPRNSLLNEAEAFSPTLAPPQKVVFVQVETDKPDLEIGWGEN